MKYLVIVLAIVMLSGCASLTAFPPRYLDASLEIAVLQPYLLPDVAVQCRDTVCRNQWIDAAVRATDLSYAGWKQSFWSENTGMNLGSSLLTMALGGLGGLGVGGATVVPYLAAGAAGVAGGMAAFSKAALGEKAILPLTMAMDAGRENIVADLIECEMSSMDVCPMLLALHLVEAYYQVGSVPGGLGDIVTRAMESKVQARQRLRIMRGVK